eukprot:jgi/Psemu1/41963/gm1.41963_g
MESQFDRPGAEKMCIEHSPKQQAERKICKESLFKSFKMNDDAILEVWIRSMNSPQALFDSDDADDDFNIFSNKLRKYPSPTHETGAFITAKSRVQTKLITQQVHDRNRCSLKYKTAQYMIKIKIDLTKCWQLKLKPITESNKDFEFSPRQNWMFDVFVGKYNKKAFNNLHMEEKHITLETNKVQDLLGNIKDDRLDAVKTFIYRSTKHRSSFTAECPQSLSSGRGNISAMQTKPKFTGKLKANIRYPTGFSKRFTPEQKAVLKRLHKDATSNSSAMTKTLSPSDDNNAQSQSSGHKFGFAAQASSSEAQLHIKYQHREPSMTFISKLLLLLCEFTPEVDVEPFSNTYDKMQQDEPVGTRATAYYDCPDTVKR